MKDDAARPGVELAPVFPVLDTLRAVGAFAVLTTHVGFQTGEYLRNGTWGVFLARLDLGVAIFFVLSGFLLSRPHFARAALGAPRPAVQRYFAKRVLRIFPVYLVTVVLALWLAPENEKATVGQAFSSALLLDPYRLPQLPHGLTHMWSLAAEVAFYALLPLLMLWAVSRRGLSATRVGGLLGVMIACSLVWHLWVIAALREGVAGAPGIWLPAYLSWFAAGIALAYLHVRVEAGDRSRLTRSVIGLASMPGVCWTIVLGLVLVASTSIAGPVAIVEPTAAESGAKHVLYALIGALLVASGVFADPRGTYARFMSWTPLRHLGHISYSIFCIHMLILVGLSLEVAGVEPFRGEMLRVWVVTVVLAIVASELLYAFVEMPSLRLKDRAGRAGRSIIRNSTPTADARTR